MLEFSLLAQLWNTVYMVNLREISQNFAKLANIQSLVTLRRGGFLEQFDSI